MAKNMGVPREYDPFFFYSFLTHKMKVHFARKFSIKSEKLAHFAKKTGPNTRFFTQKKRDAVAARGLARGGVVLIAI